MSKYLAILFVICASLLLGLSRAPAYGEAPWCAVFSLGEGSSAERCEFWDFESCRLEITGGNRGFCNHNPRWTGRTGPSSRKPSPRSR